MKADQQPTTDPQIDAIVDGVIRDRSAGAGPTDDEILARYPQLAVPLREALERLAVIEQAVKWASMAQTSLDPILATHGPVEVPGYTIERELASGAQGTVYVGRKPGQDGLVAVKVLRQGMTPKSVERLLREEAVLSRLRHPNLAVVQDRGVTSDGRPFLVLDYIEGEPLGSLLGPASDVRSTLGVLARVCRAMHAAHEAGVIHRDLKPSNILVRSDGEPVVVDFGLATDNAARTVSLDLTLDGQFVGSIAWASPEQLAGQSVDRRSDVYALGVMLYQAATGGRLPFASAEPGRGMLGQILHRRALVAGIDPRLGRIIASALEKDPRRRTASAERLAVQIERYLHPSWIRRHRRGLAVFAVTAVLAVAGAVALRPTPEVDLLAPSPFAPTGPDRPSFVNSVRMGFVWIEPGEFIMGSTPGTLGHMPDEQPTAVRIDQGFYMARSEVTQEAYEKVMGVNPSRFAGINHPVERVSFFDAVEFCRRLSEMEGRTYRLPTEAEWEFAARGGTTTMWFWGNSMQLAPRYANFNDASFPAEQFPGTPREHPELTDGMAYTSGVFNYIPGPRGLSGILGNVWEWTSSVYHHAYRHDPTTSPQPGQLITARGGSWFDPLVSLRPSHRNPLDPNTRTSTLGFRVVLEAGER